MKSKPECKGSIIQVIPGVEKCSVIKRLNRFVVEAYTLSGEKLLVHNTNTGRLEDILYPGSTIICKQRRREGVTTHYLIGSEVYGGSLINTSLQEKSFELAVNRGLISWLKGCNVKARAPRIGDSRLDFLLDCKGKDVLVELKSAVLRGPNMEAMYPDCPTERGRRHIELLGEIAAIGDSVFLVFISGFPGARVFTPYRKGDPLLPSILKEAMSKGLQVRSIGLCLRYIDGKAHIILYNDNIPVVVS